MVAVTESPDPSSDRRAFRLTRDRNSPAVTEKMTAGRAGTMPNADATTPLGVVCCRSSFHRALTRKGEFRKTTTDDEPADATSNECKDNRGQATTLLGNFKQS